MTTAPRPENDRADRWAFRLAAALYAAWLACLGALAVWNRMW